MISVREEQFQSINRKYRAAFGEGIPLMMIPENETVEELAEKVSKSLVAGKNLLPEMYNWNDVDVY